MPPDYEIVVDTRSLWVILLNRSRNAALLAVGGLLYWWIASRPLPSGLSPEAQKALAVFQPHILTQAGHIQARLWVGRLSLGHISQHIPQN